jgi:hypothetical protein
MQTPLPAAGPLVDWLRAEAQAPFTQPRGDVGDQLPLLWLVPLAERDARIPFAVGELLREGNLMVSRRLLQVAVLAEAGPQLRSSVARVLADVAPTLAALHDGDRSLLRVAVETVALPARMAGPLPPDALATLRTIDRREDGWPLSLAITLIGDVAAALDLVAPAAARMKDDDMPQFMLELAAIASEAVVAATLQRIAADATPAVCTHVGAGLKAQLAQFDEYRDTMVAMGITLPPRESGASRWQRYVPLLGLTP